MTGQMDPAGRRRRYAAGAAVVCALALAACSGPDARVRALCLKAGNSDDACGCLADRLKGAAPPEEIRALLDGDLGEDGLPVGASPEAVVTFADAIAACGVVFPEPPGAPDDAADATGGT